MLDQMSLTECKNREGRRVLENLGGRFSTDPPPATARSTSPASSPAKAAKSTASGSPIRTSLRCGHRRGWGGQAPAPPPGARPGDAERVRGLSSHARQPDGRSRNCVSPPVPAAVRSPRSAVAPAPPSRFAERSPAVAAIPRQSSCLGALDRVKILGGSALALPKSQPFDLIFADPPYAPDPDGGCREQLRRPAWLAAGGWMAVETERGDPRSRRGAIESEPRRGAPGLRFARHVGFAEP